MLLSLMAGLAAAAPAERVSVCHQSGARTAVLEVSASALAGHRGHGDHLVGDEVCGNEVDDDCDGEVDEGCACPCYDAEDLGRLHAEWLSWQANEDLVYAYTTCEERFTTIDYANGGSFDSDVVQLYFYGYSVDIAPDGTWVSFLGGEGAFYGVSYDWDYPWGAGSERYCSSYASTSAYEDGAYTSGEDPPTFEYLDDAQAEACQLLLLDWAAAAGLECTTTTEHLDL